MTATIPPIPTELAGKIAASADLNAWSAAASFHIQSSSGNRPRFLLTCNAVQSLSNLSTILNWSNSGAVFKDNDGGFNPGDPSMYTVQTAGFWTINFSVSAAPGSSSLFAQARVVTSATNPFRPSEFIPFCSVGAQVPASFPGIVTNGGLVPVYLTPGDVIQVLASVDTTSGNTSNNPYPMFSGEWVETSFV